MANFRYTRAVFIFLIGIFISCNPAFAEFAPEDQSNYPFAVPPGLESRVNFWKKIYTEYTTQQAIVHDIDDLRVIYEVVDLDAPSRRSEARLNAVKNKYKNILNTLATKSDHSNLSLEESRVAKMVRGNYQSAARNIRVQIGQKNRFREGLIRSGLYMDKIRAIFREYGLPDELTALPHVESSFQIGAYSSAGAAGIWQFTRGTGRLFLNVGYEVDERRDPILATVAAAKLLKKNYEELHSWPLAITAYNHGLGGMIRAKRLHGDDIVNIIDRYDSRSFGFASGNFYSEFLAAMEVSRNHKKYFPDVVMPPPLQTVAMRFNEYVSMETVRSYFKMTTDQVAEYNPALRPPVLSGKKRIPAGYIFKAPPDKLPAISSSYRSIPASLKYDDQIPSKWHTVSTGETLSSIATRFKVSVEELKRLNNIDHKNRIQRGQVLQLPTAPPKEAHTMMAKLEDKVKIQSDAEARQAPANDDKTSDQPESVNVNVDGDKDLETLKNIREQQQSVRKEKEVVVEKTGGNEFFAYTVQKGDNLSAIARKFNASISNLAELNQMKMPYSLRIGQPLKIPRTMVMAQAMKEVSTPHSSDKKKFYLKVENNPKEEKGDSSGKNGNQPDENESVKIEFPKNETTLLSGKSMNKNRPAFLPVLFSSKSTNNSRKTIGTITVDFDETLSHYAEWAGVAVPDILKANKFSPHSKIKVNQKIKIPFTGKTPESFTENRQEFHRGIQEDFYSNFRVSQISVRPIKKGETLWDICTGTYVIPFWLLSNYNPDKDIASLSEGQNIVVPTIVPLKSSDA